MNTNEKRELQSCLSRSDSMLLLLPLHGGWGSPECQSAICCFYSDLRLITIGKNSVIWQILLLSRGVSEIREQEAMLCVFHKEKVKGISYLCKFELCIQTCFKEDLRKSFLNYTYTLHLLRLHPGFSLRD